MDTTSITLGCRGRGGHGGGGRGESGRGGRFGRGEGGRGRSFGRGFGRGLNGRVNLHSDVLDRMSGSNDGGSRTRY